MCRRFMSYDDSRKQPSRLVSVGKDSIDKAVRKVLEMDGIFWAKRLQPLKVNFPRISAVPMVSVWAAVRRRSIWP